MESGTTPLVNGLKRKLASGGTVLGTWSIVPSPIVVEIIGYAGLDFTILDMEHGLFPVDALDACLRACETGGVAGLVRVPGMNHSATQWALDLGAHGIVVPQVNTAEDARTVVEMSKFAPLGRRGYNPFTRFARYANPTDLRGGKLDNAFSLTCAIVESQTAIDELDAICETAELDVIYIGVYDLSVALGCAGNTSDPVVLNAVEKSARKIRDAGKAAGLMVRSQANVASSVALGANFLVYSVDTEIIREGFVGARQRFLAGLGDRP